MKLSLKDKNKFFRPREVDFHSWSFFMRKPKCGVCWLFNYFLRFVNIFLSYFFRKQASKDHLIQGNLLKTILLNEKSNLEKDMYETISLYSQHFSCGAGSNVLKTLLLLKTNEKVFYFIFLNQKSSI